MIYAIETDPVKKAILYFSKVKDSLEIKDMSNPFIGHTKLLVDDKKALMVINVRPVLYDFGNIFIFGIILGNTFCYYFSGRFLPLWITTVLAVLSLSKLFWSPRFYFFISRIALKKGGYGGKVTFYHGSKLAERLEGLIK